MLLRERIGVIYYGNHTKHIITLCGKVAEFVRCVQQVVSVIITALWTVKFAGFTH
jgi:hypothetical protein